MVFLFIKLSKTQPCPYEVVQSLPSSVQHEKEILRAFVLYEFCSKSVIKLYLWHFRVTQVAPWSVRTVECGLSLVLSPGAPLTATCVPPLCMPVCPTCADGLTRPSLPTNAQRRIKCSTHTLSHTSSSVTND